MPCARGLGEVDRVLLERLVLGLRRRAVDAGAAAHLLQRAVDLLLVDAELLQDARRLALALVGRSRSGCARRRRTRPAGARPRRSPPRACARCAASCRSARRRTRASAPCPAPARRRPAAASASTPSFSKISGVIPLPYVQQRQQHVLDVPLRVAFLAHQLLARRQHFLRAFCESVLSHHVRLFLSLVDLLCRGRFVSVAQPRSFQPRTATAAWLSTYYRVRPSCAITHSPVQGCDIRDLPRTGAGAGVQSLPRSVAASAVLRTPSANLSMPRSSNVRSSSWLSSLPEVS